MDQNTKDVLMMALPIVSTVGLAYIAYKQSAQAKAQAKIAEDVVAVAAKVEIVKLATDGLTSKLVVAEKEASHAEGKDEERTEQKAREAERAIGSKAVKDSGAVPGPLVKEKNGAAEKLPRDKSSA